MRIERALVVLFCSSIIFETYVCCVELIVYGYVLTKSQILVTSRLLIIFVHLYTYFFLMNRPSSKDHVFRPNLHYRSMCPRLKSIILQSPSTPHNGRTMLILICSCSISIIKVVRHVIRSSPRATCCRKKIRYNAFGGFFGCCLCLSFALFASRRESEGGELTRRLHQPTVRNMELHCLGRTESQSCSCIFRIINIKIFVVTFPAARSSNRLLASQG